MALTLDRGRGLVGSGIVVGVAVAAANGLNVAFQLALARILDPAEYSLLAALFTVVLVAQVTTIAFQASVAREMAQSLAAGRRAENGKAPGLCRALEILLPQSL